MRQQRQTFEERLGARIVVVSFQPPAEVAAFTARERVPFLMLSDPERMAYRAWGLGRNPWRHIYTLSTALAYLNGLFTGHMPRLGSKDALQMGGDFVVGRGGALVYAHASRDPADRPSTDELVAALASGHSDG